MIDLEHQLRDLFQERSEAANPDPDLHAVMSGAPRVTLIASEPEPSGTRRLVLVAAVLAILAGVGATAIAYRTRPAHHPPSTPVTYPDVIPPAPIANDAQMSAMEPHFYALTVDGASLRLDTGKSHIPLVGDAGAPVNSPWKQWTSASGSLIDSDGTTPGGFYVITCCTPGGVIWRNGVQLTAGTHMDYLLRPSGPHERVTLDPATSTVTQDLGDRPSKIVESGAIDVALVDLHTMGILVGGPAPKLVITTGSATSRRVLPLPSGSVEPCAVVALRGRLVVLLGAPRGNDPCVGDRAFVVDGVTGHITATLRTPAEVRGLNSNHADKVIAVTVDGNVVLGDFSVSPSWITLLKGHYLSAGIW